MGDLKIEAQIMAILVLALDDQSLMLKDKLKQDSKHRLNMMINNSKLVLKSMGLNLSNNQEYYANYTDILHLQLNEFRKVLIELENEKSTSTAK